MLLQVNRGVLLAALVVAPILGCNAEQQEGGDEGRLSDGGVVEASAEQPAPLPVTVPPRAAPALPMSGRPAPSLTLPAVEGGAAWTLADHLDPTGESCPNAVLLAFMASWCTYCTQSLPSLVELQEQYPELEIVTVTVDTSAEAQRAEFAKVRAAGLTGPVLAADAGAVDAWIGGGKSVPKYYFVNRVGTITAKDDGFGDKVKPMLARQAERALGG